MTLPERPVTLCTHLSSNRQGREIECCCENMGIDALGYCALVAHDETCTYTLCPACMAVAITNR
jgi:hypothetical protein